MEITIDIPRKFNIEPDQIRKYLIGNNWKQEPHSDRMDKFQSPKYTNAIVVFPKPKELNNIDPEDLIDIKYILFSTLRFIANVENTDIETIIQKINDFELCDCGHPMEDHIDGMECRGNNLNCMCDQFNAQIDPNPE